MARDLVTAPFAPMGLPPTDAELEAATTAWFAHVDAFEGAAATASLAALVDRVRVDPDRAIALLETLYARVDGRDEDAAIACREAAFELACTTGRFAAALDLACALVHLLDDICQEEKIAPVIAALVTRWPAQTYAIHVRLAAQHADDYALTLRIAALRVAIDAAPDPAARLDRAIELAAALRVTERDDERAALIPGLRAMVASGAALDAAVRAHLELAAGGADDDARRAEELARTGRVDAALLHAATRAYASVLDRAGELVRVEALLAALPGCAALAATVPVEPEDLDTRDEELDASTAFLEDVRRRLGMTHEPPADAFVPRPLTDEERAAFAPFTGESLLAPVIAHFTRDPDPFVMLGERRLMSGDLILVASHGRVTCEADLDSQKIFGPARDFTCGCGRYMGGRYRGRVCERCAVEVIQAVTRTYRPGHLRLAHAVVHPWYERLVATLLGATIAAVRAFDPEDLKVRLRSVADDEYIYERKRDRERKSVEVSDRLRDSGTRPTAFAIDTLPVWPPAAVLPAGVDRGELRAAYVAALAPDPRPGVAALFALF